MAVFKTKAKNNIDVDKKPRVYFTCHPDDFEKYFEKNCEDIFKTHDCTIYYTEDMSEAIDEEEKELSLGRNNLFVVPVTYRLLATPNRAMDEDIPYALKNHIPVLPFMMESGIDVLYSKPDKFGELQYLAPYSNDLTEISYEEKLKKYLEAVLISDELTARVRAAFDAYVFLSYRKKDRKYANELMRLIHSNKECRDIAIWFDEFLTPGESFKENIERILDDCNLFALLVTPRLLEKVVDEHGNEWDNYVISTELPLAQKKKEEKGTDIFAVEMEETDKAALSAIHVENCVNAKEVTFRARLLDVISRIAITANDTPEHNFLIGLAYLDGIDVEVNRELALELITSAAQAGLPEAMAKLYLMYSEGIGVPLDYRKSVVWIKSLADHYMQVYGEEHPDTLTALNDLAVTYSKLGEYQNAAELFEKVYALCCRIFDEQHPNTLTALNNIATTYSDLGEYDKALKLKEMVYALLCKIQGEENPDTLAALNNLALTYNNLGERHKAAGLLEKVYVLRCKLLSEEHPDALLSLSDLAVTYSYLGKHKEAVKLLAQVYALQCKHLGEEHPDTLTTLNNLAVTYSEFGKHKEAVKSLEKVYVSLCKNLGEEHPNTLRALGSLALTYREFEKYDKAMECLKKAYASLCKILGEEHPDTLKSLNSLALTYGDLGDCQKEVELLEKVYVLQCKHLGEEHPDTLTSLNNLAMTYGDLGDCEKEVELSEKVYALRFKILGEEHPDTLAALNNLAVTYSDLNEYSKAISLGKQAYTLYDKVLGETHADTLASLSNLAYLYQAAGDYNVAHLLYEKLYAHQEAVYGADDPQTMETRDRLEQVRAKLQGET